MHVLHSEVQRGEIHGMRGKPALFGARKFGNLMDPNSEIRYILEHMKVFRLKEEINTNPKFFYFFSMGTGVKS